MRLVHLRLLVLALAVGAVLFGLSAATTQARPGSAQSAAQPAAGTASLGLTGPASAVPQGQSFAIPLDATQLADALSAFQVDVSFDPAILAFNGVTPGPLLATTGRAVVCPPAEQTAAGRVRFACASAGDGAGPTATGTLATLSFSALRPGSSPLALEAVQLVDGARPPALFSVSSQNASVTVSAAPAAPTATPSSFDLFLPNVETGSQSVRETTPQAQPQIFLPDVGR